MTLIIFDFDGVLADTLDDLLQFSQEICDELGVKHVVIKEDISNLEVMSFATLGRACEVPEHLVEEFVQSSLKRIAAKKFPPAIFDGLSDVVKKFAVKNSIAIVTTNSSQNVNAFLVEHGLKECVHAIYGVDQPGTKAQKISMAREQLAKNTGSESVFMIGDALSDIRSAKEAGAKSIAVSWGHQRVSHLLRGEPDYVVHSPAELIDIIGT